MKREEYLNHLKLSLEQNDFGPVEEAIAYFNEVLEDRIAEEGMGEEEAVATLEAPEAVAAQLAQPQQTGAIQPENAPEPILPGVREVLARPDQVRQITIKDRNMRLILQGWDRDEIRLRHPESEKIRYDFSLENGVMSLIRRPAELSFHLFQFESLSPEMGQVTLDVPRELAAGLDLHTSNGRLSAQGVHCWGTAVLRTSNGSLKAVDFSAKAITCTTSNGSLTIEQVKAQKELQAQSSNGKITATGVSAPEKVRLATSNGTIEVHGLESSSIELASSNGSIRGDLPGKQQDYSIRSATNNGRNSLPLKQDGGAQTLSVHTSNARIDLAFVNGGAGSAGSQEGLQDMAEQLARDALKTGRRAAQMAEEGMAGLEGRIEQAVEQSLDSAEALSERITRAVEEALARALEGRGQGPDKGNPEG